MARELVISERVTIPGRDLSVTAVRASGPGGQNVNKVASKIELRFDLKATQALGAAAKERLLRTAGWRIDAQGWLRVTSQESRDQSRNLELARERLAALIRAALVVPKKRRASRPTRAAKERRLSEKRVLSKKKQARGRPSHDD